MECSFECSIDDDDVCSMELALEVDCSFNSLVEFSKCSVEFFSCSSDSSESEERNNIFLRGCAVDWVGVSLGVSRGRWNAETFVGRGNVVVEVEFGRGKSRTTKQNQHRKEI